MKRLLPIMILLCLLGIQGLAQTQIVNNGEATTPIVLQGTGCDYRWTVDQSIGLVPLGSGNVPSFTAVNTGTQPITAHITAKPITPLFNAYMANQFAGNVATVGTEDRGIPGTPAVGTGLRSYGIAVTLDGTGMVVTNQTAKTVAVFRQFLNFRLITTLSVGDSPKGIAISPDGSTAYVVNSSDGVVWMIDMANAALAGTFTVSSTLQDATGITVSPDGNRLYITYNQSGIMAVVDAHAHTLIKQVVVGSAPAGVAVSDDGKYVYVANQDGNSVSVINTTANYSVTSVTVGSKPFGIVATHNGSRVYVTNQGDNTVSCITTSNNSVSTIPVGHGPIGISVSPDDQFVLVANHDEPDNNVSVIHTADNSVTYESTYRGQGNFSFGNFIPGGVGCSPVPITFDITVNPTPPSITATGPLAALTTSYKVPSASTSFTVSGLSLPGPIFVGPPPGFEVSTDNINFNSSGVNLGTSGNITGTVYVRLAATTSPGTYSGNINLSSGSVTASIATAPSTVNPAQPYVSVGPVSGKVTSCLGSPSTSTLQFTLTAIELNAALTATASGPFEVSLRPDYGFSNSIEVANISGDLGPTVIYVRVAANPTAGRVRGGVALRTNGAASRNVDVSGLVYPAPVAKPVGNQRLLNGNNTQAVHFTGVGSNTFTWTTDHPEIGFLAANGTGDISSFRAVNPGTTPITATVTAYPVSTGLIYVSNIGLNPNTGTSTVAVINPTDNTLIASIPVGASPKTMVINEDATRIYVANNVTSDVSVIDLGTNQKIATIPVGTAPLGMSFNDDGTQLSVYNTDDFSISVIDVATNTLIATRHTTDRYPPGSIKSIDGHRIYVYNFSPGPSYFVYDAATNDLITTFGLGGQPGGLALSPDGTKAYLANSTADRVEVYDANTYALITTVDVGDQPTGISITRDGKQLYVANQGDNTVSVINTDLYDVTTLRSDNGSFALPTAAISTGGTGCSGLPAVFTITVDPTPPTIIAAGTPADLFTTAGVASPSSSFSLSGINLTQGITIQPPAGFEVSVDDLHFFPVLTVGSAGNMPPATIYVRLTAAAAVGSYTDDIRLSSSPAADVLVHVTGTVAAAVPTVTGSAATGTITACVGNASLSPNVQQFTVSGFLLTANAVATAPLGFELSLSAGGPYNSSVPIPQSGGNIAGTVVYVRSSVSAPAGLISGNVQLSGGSIMRNVIVNGNIHPPPEVKQVADKDVTDGTHVTVNFDGTGNSYSWENSNPNIGLTATSGAGNIAFNATNRGISPITADIKVRPHSASLAYIPASGYVYVEDLATNTQVEKIRVGTTPYAVAASPDGLRVYVANQGDNSISVINTGSNTIAATISLGNINTNPSGLAISPDGSRLYVSDRSTKSISVINTATNAEILPRIPVDNGPEGMVVSPDGSRVYVVNQNSGTVSVIEPASNLRVASFNTGSTPEGIAITPDGGQVYVSNYNNHSVTVFNARTNAVSAILVGTNPTGVAVSPDGSRVYVANSGSNTVSVINTADNTVLTTIGGLLGTSPKGISVSPDGLTVYTANYISGNVSVIDMHSGHTVISTIDNIPSPVSYGSFITAGSGCDGAQMTFQITVEPSATNISVTGAPSALTTTYGTPSASTSFNVSGINMSGGILVTAPAGFEVSADGALFTHTVTIGSAGTIATTPVYIRLAAGTAAGSYAGNIPLASGVNTLNVPMPQSLVNPATLTITADDKSRLVGVDNPVLTASFVGFVSPDGPTHLTAQPILSTLADRNSPAGQYPITVTGAAASANYAIVYVPGVLTVRLAGASLVVANAFTPNGDGINDTWVIHDLDTYPGCTVAVFNRNGLRVFFSVNYPTPWNGRYNGADLPAGTYYYIITPGNGFKPIAGYLAIIR